MLHKKPTDIRQLKQAIDELQCVLSKTAKDEFGFDVELGDIEDIKNPIQKAINKLKRQYTAKENELKKTARRRIIVAISKWYWGNRGRFNYPSPSLLSNNDIWDIANCVIENCNLKKGSEFFNWYLGELNDCPNKYIYGNKLNNMGYSTYPKQDVFFRDVIRAIANRG